jgi:hypothetical protein
MLLFTCPVRQRCGFTPPPPLIYGFRPLQLTQRGIAITDQTARLLDFATSAQLSGKAAVGGFSSTFSSDDLS